MGPVHWQLLNLVLVSCSLIVYPPILSMLVWLLLFASSPSSDLVYVTQSYINFELLLSQH